MPQELRQPAANQLVDYAEEHKNEPPSVATTTFGAPNPNKDALLTVGKKGPALLQDWEFLDEMGHFTRERIPERVVHAKGAGAFGHFEVTHDITQYTAAKVFSHVGKRTSIAVRFSQVAGEMGSADTVRDLRGFAVKFYTEDGIWDIVGNNTPIFFIRDAVLFPSFIHIMKRNPVTHLRDLDMLWDFLTLREEAMPQLLRFFSDEGIPANYRQMNGYGSNTFALVNEYQGLYYCKFHYETNQGLGYMDTSKASRLASEDPDYYIRDLYNAIASGNYPSWTLSIQIMTPDEAASCPFDPYDVTKVWPLEQFPLVQVGKFVLDKNPRNYFAEIEQLAFNPANLVPGIEPSPDRMLQGRLFAYGDTHRYRLGVNYLQLPVNAPFKVADFSRDGFMTLDNQAGAPNYHPNSFGGPNSSTRAKKLSPNVRVSGQAMRYDSGGEEWNNYGQAKDLYRKMDHGQRSRLVENIVNSLKQAAEFLQKRAVKNFSKVSEELAKNVTAGLNAKKKTVANL